MSECEEESMRTGGTSRERKSEHKTTTHVQKKSQSDLPPRVCKWGGCQEGPQRSGVDPPLSSSRACLHMAFIANSVPFGSVSLGQLHPVLLPPLPE